MEQTPSDIYASNGQNMNPEEHKKRPYRRHHTKTASELTHPRYIFTYDEQVEIVKQIAMYKNQNDIVKYVENQFGKKLTKVNLNNYATRPQWQPMIDKFRQEFEAKITDEDLASKRRRVQELSKMYWRLEVRDDALPKAAQMISLIREEIEGKTSGGTTINQYNQYNGISDDDLRKVIDENTRFLEIAEKRKQEITLDIQKEDGIAEGSNP